MPSSFARATRSVTRDSPSSRLYSLCVWRWTNWLTTDLSRPLAGSAAAEISLLLTRDVDDERAVVGRFLRVLDRERMGLSAHDAAAPDVIDALRRLLPGRRVAGCRTEVVEPEFAEEPDLDVAGRRVQVTRDD